MFSKHYRLPAFIRLTNSLIVHSPFFTIRIAKNNLTYNRYGFIISKKIDKRSVVRNRIKRQIRACVEKLHPELITGHDFLLSIKKEAVNQKTEDLYSDINKLFVEKKMYNKFL